MLDRTITLSCNKCGKSRQYLDLALASKDYIFVDPAYETQRHYCKECWGQMIQTFDTFLALYGSDCLQAVFDYYHKFQTRTLRRDLNATQESKEQHHERK